MRHIISLLWLGAGLAVLGSPSASFAQCVIFDKPEELYVRSDVVFRGKVIARRPTGSQGEHVIVDIATFQVGQAWKGKVERQVEVEADRPFAPDREYLVFAGGKPLSTSILCRATELIERAQTKLEWLLKRQLPN